MPNTFGSFLKELRIKRGDTLRAFCTANGFDPGNYSRMERGILAPPHSEEKIEEYAVALGLKKGSDEWLELFDRAAASRGEIPSDLMNDEEIIGKLPLLFRTLRGKPISPDRLDDLVKKLKGR